MYIFQEVIIKTNFFNSGKKIAKLEEESIIVEKVFKAAKSAGIKKLRLRTAESVCRFKWKMNISNYVEETMLQSS